MSTPLCWLPTLDISNVDVSFGPWLAHRFLSSFRGRGHIISQSPGPWPSQETIQATSGGQWYCRGLTKVPKRSKPIGITAEISVPTGLADPALDVLNHALQTGPLVRLVAIRPHDLNLHQAETSLRTLLDTVIDTIWLDQQSFGWNALTWLIASDPRFQPAGISPQDVWRLSQLAEQLGRPLVLRDFSGKPDVPLPGLHHFSPEQSVPRALNSLPAWGRSP